MTEGFRPQLEHLEERTLLSAGAPDPTFGNGGVAVIQAIEGGEMQRPMAMAVQPDGKVVAAGQGEVERLNADGSPDATFGQDGRVVLPPVEIVISTLVIEPDGKILLAGTAGYPSVSQFGLLQLNSDGTLDTTFGRGGVVTTGFGISDTANSMVLQPDGKIVVVGSSDGQIALARYDSNGQLDPTFGSGGEVLTSLGTDAQANAVAVTPAGQIVVAGAFATSSQISFFEPNNSTLFVAQYNADGSLDSTFGAGGITQPVNFTSNATAVAVEPDGTVVVAGFGRTGVSVNDILIRLTPDGQPDAIFGNNGVVDTNIPVYTNDSLALEGDGKILLASDSPINGDGHFVLARYNADGSVDTTFGDDGQATATFGQVNIYFDQVAFAPNGEIYVGGWSAPGVNSPLGASGLTLARFENDYVPPGGPGTSGGSGTNPGDPVPSSTGSSSSVTVTPSTPVVPTPAAPAPTEVLPAAEPSTAGSVSASLVLAPATTVSPTIGSTTPQATDRVLSTPVPSANGVLNVSLSRSLSPDPGGVTSPLPTDLSVSALDILFGLMEE
jgi:uncharacterized delta-60 repeat protein